MDADPDGLSILQTYRRGSASLPHEHAVNLPEMRWLGVKIDDVLDGKKDDECVMRLSARDRGKTAGMLRRLGADSCEDVNGEVDELRAELQKMLMLNIKAEMQILGGREGGLVQWLERRLGEESSLAGRFL
jgi:meiotic recombination protein SPO11